MISLLRIALFVLTAYGTLALRNEPLQRRVVMDEFGKFVMSWTPHDKEIEIQLEVSTRGYVGVGFSPNGGMRGADIVVAWITEDGQIHITDRHGTGNASPPMDPSQDLELVSGGRNTTHTVVRFRRPWITCDEEHDFALTPGSTTRVIWAYDSSTPSSAAPLSYHSHRGVKSLHLREPQLRGRPLPDDVQHWDLRNSEVTLPNDVNSLYWCTMFKMPELQEKHHVIGYEPLISARMLPHVHHMIVFECQIQNSSRHYEQWVSLVGAQCHSPNMPLSWNACGAQLIVWGIGSNGGRVPEHVGFPLGEEHNGATYFMLQTHYDNPDLVQDIRDSSGIRVFHTNKLREHDAGTLAVGHRLHWLIIPPNKEWVSTGHCKAECTRSSLPETGIQVFSALLHAHLLGRAITLQHVRQDEEMPVMFDDHSYDFNYQTDHILKEERTVLPGDHLIVSCRYDAHNRNQTTFGGFNTYEEMCMVFVQYYPRQNLAKCLSNPAVELVLDTFGIKDFVDKDKILKGFERNNNKIDNLDQEVVSKQMQKMKGNSQAGEDSMKMELSYRHGLINITNPTELAGRSFLDILNDPVTWEQEATVRSLQEAATRGDYHSSCSRSDNKQVEGVSSHGKYPAYTPHQQAKEACTRAGKDTLQESASESTENKTSQTEASDRQPVDDDVDGAMDRGQKSHVGLEYRPGSESKDHYDIDLKEIGHHYNTQEYAVQGHSAEGHSAQDLRSSEDLHQSPEYQDRNVAIIHVFDPLLACFSLIVLLVAA